MSALGKIVNACKRVRDVVAELDDAADLVAPRSEWCIVAVDARGDVLVFFEHDGACTFDEATARAWWSRLEGLKCCVLPEEAVCWAFYEAVGVLEGDVVAVELVEVEDNGEGREHVRARHEVA